MDVSRDPVQPLPDLLKQLFAPMHKLALGLSVALVAGLSVFAVTMAHVIMRPVDGPPLYLLGQYFYGYDVSWRGALIGFWWGAVAGFAGGWFMAFARNAALATWLFVIRARAEAMQTRDFLDHI